MRGGIGEAESNQPKAAVENAGISVDSVTVETSETTQSSERGRKEISPKQQLQEEPTKSLRWHGKENVRVDDVPKPEIKNPTDAIIEITAAAICGSDLHLYGNFMPTMNEGDI